MRRRDFLAGFAAAMVLPVAARGQQPERMRQIGVLFPGAVNDPQFQARYGAFLQELQKLGWMIGRNVRVDVRWAANLEDLRKHAAELTALSPDVLIANGSSAVIPLMRATRIVPIVFPIATDPVGAGIVDSLARPGGNVTGFMNFEYGMGGKWLELLKQIAPNTKRAAVLRDPRFGSGTSQFAAIQSVAPSLNVEISPINIGDVDHIERNVAAFAKTSNGGLILTSGAGAIRHRELIIKLAAEHKLPAVYNERFFVADGGLASYGPNQIDQFRLAAGYVDRILKGESPGELPVQLPTKLELVLNLKTAKTLGLTLPPTLLARADEVIE
jgi:putative ABC transport system substrate-binding protein